MPGALRRRLRVHRHVDRLLARELHLDGHVLSDIRAAPDSRRLLAVPLVGVEDNPLARPLCELAAEHGFQADAVRLVERELLGRLDERDDALHLLLAVVAREAFDVDVLDRESRFLALEFARLDEAPWVELVPVHRFRECCHWFRSLFGCMPWSS